jgi:hypothetical protein
MARGLGLNPATPAKRTTVLAGTDAHGHPTDDPAAIVGGEVVEHDAHGRPTRRTPFFLTEREMPLPVSEPAFLLWVLAAFIAAWIVVALIVLS